MNAPTNYLNRRARHAAAASRTQRRLAEAVRVQTRAMREVFPERDEEADDDASLLREFERAHAEAMEAERYG